MRDRFTGATEMPQTSTVNLTIENYLTYDDGTDNRYELVDGAIVVVPLPSADHADKIDLLLEIFRAEIRRNNLPMKASDKAGSLHRQIIVDRQRLLSQS